MTIRNLLKWAIITLKGSDIEDPELNADTLLAFILSCDRAELYTYPDNVVKDDDITSYRELINKRIRHVPLQYITKHAEFMSLDFVVDERVLIPRPETEILVEAVLNKTCGDGFTDNSIIILDIGTGSGNIAVSLAKSLSNAVLYAGDISREALLAAGTNARRHDVVDRVHILHGDLFDAFHGYVEKGKADFIVSNPPYVSESEWNRLEPELKDYEPRKALVAGKDGLYFHRQIISGAVDWLKPHGYLIMENGENQADKVIKLMEDGGHYRDIETIKDLHGIERVVMGST